MKRFLKFLLGSGFSAGPPSSSLLSRSFMSGSITKASTSDIMITRPDQAVTIGRPRDPNTLSNYHNFRTTHTAVDLKVDFEKRLLGGSVVLTFTSQTDGETDELTLDSSFLKISSVKVAGNSVKWDVKDRVEPYGSALAITLDSKPKKDEKFDVEIEVSTTDKCTALQWMTPAQTSNGKHPYMFSQCQAIHARSIFPCQDTPDVKSTVDFRITSPLPVLCSGLPKESGSQKDLYVFKQSVPIPSYLFAIASGDIEGASIGPRSMVWTGPNELKGAQWELEQDTETYLQVAEKIVFPYEWGTYNVLVLPPSFPYGGMENPVYTFATPTIISGDKQNIDVIAHELAHSWSGNLVSPGSWEHFWLNEGWTTYIERRIQGAIHGEAHRHFSAIIGWKGLQDTIEQFGDENPLTALIPDLKGKDPDDAFSQIPYEKGFTFLFYLEKLIGIEKWDKFIPHYFSTFKYKSLDSYEFKATLTSFFESDAEANDALSKVDWDAWFYKPGFPPKPSFDTSMVDACYALADKWEALSTGTDTSFKPAASDLHGWVANQTVVFLERVQLFDKPLTKDLVRLMGDTYGFATSKNVELVSRYFVVALLAKDKTFEQPVADLLGRVGRMKFVRPLFRRLRDVDEQFAKSVFEKNKNFYHPICRGLVEKDLYGKSK